jgi:deaminated glutathione amidase
LKAAAVQLNSTADKAANMATAERLTRAAAADGARLIVLPEKWTVLGRDEDLSAGAEPLDGPAIAWARALARELRIDLVAGSIVERPQLDGESPSPTSRETAASSRILARAETETERDRSAGTAGERLANTAVHIDPRGELRAVYRKLHMFDVEVEGREYRESAVTEPGAEVVLSATAEGVELGLAICYDLRFPELFCALAARGARVVVLPSAFTLPTTRDHWEILVRARAIENQVFVVAANQVGPHPGGHRSGGSSLIVDPWGAVLARAADGEGFIAAELDLERQREIRARLPVLAHRRPEVYGRSAQACT